MLIAQLSIVFLMLSACCPVMAQPARSPVILFSKSAHSVLVEFFYAAGCDECREIEEEVLPPLQELMGTGMDLRKYDILNPTNYLRLAALQEKSGVRTSERVSIYVDERIHLGGLQAIKAQLIPTVEAASLQKTVVSSQRSAVSLQPTAYGLKSITPGDTILKQRLTTWTIPAIAMAGLIDGLNPCAFAAIIFFITLLAVAGKRGKELIAVGIGFCTAVFLTYFLLGFGVFHVIQKLTAYYLAGEALRWLMVAVLVVLCVMSFRDAWMFRHTGDAHTMALLLPDTMRSRIHRVMRTRLTSQSLLAGSFTIGCLVTLLESVCTGQVYAPTLVYLTRHPEFQCRALGLLLLYNIAFVIPHIIVFIAAYRGIGNKRLLAWSRINVVWSKVLLGLFFGALAVILWAW